MNITFVDFCRYIDRAAAVIIDNVVVRPEVNWGFPNHDDSTILLKLVHHSCENCDWLTTVFLSLNNVNTQSIEHNGCSIYFLHTDRGGRITKHCMELLTLDDSELD